MKKTFNLILCILFTGLSQVAFPATHSNDLADHCKIQEESKDVVLTLLQKCDLLNELWGLLISYMKVELDRYPCDGRSDMYYLVSKLNEKTHNLTEAENKLAKRYEEDVLLKDSVDALYGPKELNASSYDTFIKSFKGYYPQNLMTIKRFRAKADAVEKIYKEIFGEEIIVYYDYDWLSHLMEMAKARDGFNDEEIIEFVREPLKMIYEQEVESFNLFIEKHKDVFEEVTLLARSDFKIKSDGTKKCKIIRGKEFCTTASGYYELIKSLSDIMPYMDSLKQESAMQ